MGEVTPIVVESNLAYAIPYCGSSVKNKIQNCFGSFLTKKGYYGAN